MWFIRYTVGGGTRETTESCMYIHVYIYNYNYIYIDIVYTYLLYVTDFQEAIVRHGDWFGRVCNPSCYCSRLSSAICSLLLWFPWSLTWPKHVFSCCLVWWFIWYLCHKHSVGWLICMETPTISIPQAREKGGYLGLTPFDTLMLNK